MRRSGTLLARPEKFALFQLFEIFAKYIFFSLVCVFLSLASGSLRCPFGVMRDGPHVGKIRSRDPPRHPWQFIFSFSAPFLFHAWGFQTWDFWKNLKFKNFGFFCCMDLDLGEGYNLHDEGFWRFLTKQPSSTNFFEGFFQMRTFKGKLFWRFFRL